MHLNFTHKPNYFFFAQRLIHFISQRISSQPTEQHTESFPLAEIYAVFAHDLAATTANLDAIIGLVEQYYIGDDPQQTLVNAHHINAEQHTLQLSFNPSSLAALKLGATLNAPDAAA